MAVEVEITGVAHGGAGVGRAEGKVVMVTGGLPGDVVEVEITHDRPRFARGRVLRLIEPSAVRVSPPCPVFGRCGGCTWQDAAYPAQLEWKRQVVVSQLAHLGRLEPEVRPTMTAGDPYRYRNRIDLRAHRGEWAMHQGATHHPVVIDDCLLVVEPLRRVIEATEAGRSGKVTFRVGVKTGETAVITDRDPRPVIHEVVAGYRFRIGGRAFFQVNTEGAERLVELVGEGLSTVTSGTLLDGYSGGGLFSATAGERFDSVIGVESDRRSVSDYRVNVAHGRVVTGEMESVLPRLDPVAAAVVDPPRQGMERAAVDSLVTLGPAVVMYVSCDPASFARDARRLVDSGYLLDWVQPVDMFPQTPHVETVSRFHRQTV